MKKRIVRTALLMGLFGVNVSIEVKATCPQEQLNQRYNEGFAKGREEAERAWKNRETEWAKVTDTKMQQQRTEMQEECRKQLEEANKETQLALQKEQIKFQQLQNEKIKEMTVKCENEKAICNSHIETIQQNCGAYRRRF